MQIDDSRSGWKSQRFAIISIAASIIEFLCFVVADLLVHYSVVNTAPSPAPGVQGAMVYRVMAGIWLAGTPLSLVAGASSRSFDSSQKLTKLAIAAFVVAFFFCSLQMLV